MIAKAIALKIPYILHNFLITSIPNLPKFAAH